MPLLSKRCRNSTKLSFPAEDVGIFDRARPASLPRTRYGVGRDLWFDRPFDKLTVLSKVEGLTTLSEVEGESRKLVENRTILDPGSHPAPRDLAGMTNCDTVS